MGARGQISIVEETCPEIQRVAPLSRIGRRDFSVSVRPGAWGARFGRLEDFALAIGFTQARLETEAVEPNNGRALRGEATKTPH